MGEGHMNQIQTLIEQIKQRGFQIVADGDRIRVRGSNPPDSETWALIEKLRQHRDEIKPLLVAPPCQICGATMTEATDIYGRELWVCWECARTA